MQYHAIPCNTMQYHAKPCNTMQYNAIQCNTMQYYAIQYNTTQYHAIPCIIYNCWRSVPLPCGQYKAIFNPDFFQDLRHIGQGHVHPPRRGKVPITTLNMITAVRFCTTGLHRCKQLMNIINNQYINQHNQTYWIIFQNSFIAGFSTSSCAPVEGVTHLEIIETIIHMGQ